MLWSLQLTLQLWCQEKQPPKPLGLSEDEKIETWLTSQSKVQHLEAGL